MCIRDSGFTLHCHTYTHCVPQCCCLSCWLCQFCEAFSAQSLPPLLISPMRDLEEVNTSPLIVRGFTHDGRPSYLSLIHISEPTRLLSISYAVFCLKKKKNITLL
eukprot:TRINITY_DN23298_c0_g1_i3.p1 TRINITY_DN23298_c0_g1~~TRINITY_DN23298_c0_g1_i3.p1  ORF type:complete len:105 (-),score=15.70 TRINITY_DN23298_c0_g1_i3:35-349(-)